jgi:quinol monooxygenase YgiN
MARIAAAIVPAGRQRLLARPSLSRTNQAKGKTMNVTHGFHATITAQPGKGDELVEFLLAAAAGSVPGPATAEDCVLFLVGRSASDPDTVFVTEGWTTEEAHEKFVAETQYQDEVATGGKFPAAP